MSPVFLAIGPSNHRLLRSTKLKETLYLCLPVCAKGCNPGTPRWKRCVGQVTGKAAPGSASTLPPGAPALSPRYFYEGRLNHWPLMENSTSAPLLGGPGEVSANSTHLATRSGGGQSPPCPGAQGESHLISMNSMLLKGACYKYQKGISRALDFRALGRDLQVGEGTGDQVFISHCVTQ